MAVDEDLRMTCLQSITSPATLLPCTRHTHVFVVHAKARPQTWQPLGTQGSGLDLLGSTQGCKLLCTPDVLPHSRLQSKCGLAQLGIDMMSGRHFLYASILIHHGASVQKRSG